MLTTSQKLIAENGIQQHYYWVYSLHDGKTVSFCAIPSGREGL
jgi:hypothetical protein